MEGMTAAQAPATLTDRRTAVGLARESLRGLCNVLWQAGSDELGDVLSEVDALGQACDAARVAVVGEAVERGATGDGPAAATVTQWVIHHAPSLRSGGARVVVDAVAGFTKAVNAPVRVAVESGRLPVRSATVVMAELDGMRPLLAEGAEPHVLSALVDVAASGGARACRRLRPALLARYGLDGELEREQAAARRCVSLSQPMDLGAGLFEYRVRLDVEGKEILESALGPLSAPRPTDGAPDVRGSDRRRGDALIEIVQRGVAAAHDVPVTAKAQLFVTVDYEALRSQLAPTPAATPTPTEGRRVVMAGETVGGPGAGSLLAPETVRRLACDAAVIPVVLVGDGQVLDWGHEKRLFTPAQTKRLWLRDGGCTYPGCTMPPHWSQGHHLVHWADFGPTDLGNSALLCRHHHTTVHTRRLAGRLAGAPSSAAQVQVEWDLAPGSYDLLLAERSARGPA